MIVYKRVCDLLLLDIRANNFLNQIANNNERITAAQNPEVLPAVVISFGWPLGGLHIDLQTPESGDVPVRMEQEVHRSE